MIDTSEKNFEATIEASLLQSGYQHRTSSDYNPALSLIPQDVFDFIQATQPQEWQKFTAELAVKQYRSRRMTPMEILTLDETGRILIPASIQKQKTLLFFVL